MYLAAFWAIISQTHPVTLILTGTFLVLVDQHFFEDFKARHRR
jgi:hypothetical protein